MSVEMWLTVTYVGAAIDVVLLVLVVRNLWRMLR